MTKPTKWHVRPAETQISLGIRTVWSESLPCAQWLAKVQRFFHADKKDSDQTERMPRLIWVFAERTCHFVGLVMRWLIFITKMYVVYTNYNHLIEAILSSTHNIPLFYRRSKKHPWIIPICLLTWCYVNHQWLGLPMSKANFHGPKMFDPFKFDCIKHRKLTTERNR